VGVDNIKMDVREIEWDGVDWIELAQDRDQWKALVNTVMNYILDFIYRQTQQQIYQSTHSHIGVHH
jgi:hypothetical protein